MEVSAGCVIPFAPGQANVDADSAPTMDATNLDDVSAVVGYTATRKLAAWYAGRNLYVPAAASDGHPLAIIIGLPALRALVNAYGVEHIAFPKPDEDDRYRRMRDICDQIVEGKTCAEIAEQIGLTQRRVEQLRAELEAEGWLRYAGIKQRTGSGRSLAHYEGLALI